MNNRLSVFVSSTSEDLRQHRIAVDTAILELNLYPIMMERFPSEDITAIEACKRYLAEADIYVGIYAHRYGWIPSIELGGDGESSITALEYHWAKDQGIPRLCFLIDPTHKWPDEYRETDSKAILLQQFKDHISNEVIRVEFTTPDDLASKVKNALHKQVLAISGITIAQESSWHIPPLPVLPVHQRFIGREDDIAIMAKLLKSTGPVPITASVAGAGGS